MNEQLNKAQRQRAEQIISEFPYVFCEAVVTFEPGRTETGLSVVVPGNQTPWDCAALALAVASVAQSEGTLAYLNERDESGGFVLEID
jgi:hypothetical protein